MTRKLPLVLLLVLCPGLASASSGAAKGLTASVQGATVPGVPYRYVTISPNSPYQASVPTRAAKFTVIGRIDKRGGRLGRWWYLPARYSIPAAAPDDTSGGLSADGSTLVLSRFSWIYPPRTTGLAIVHTEERPYRRPGNGRLHQPIEKLRLPDSFSFDAISPDGSTLYLIEHLSKYYGGPYQVRALDVESGELRPEPIVDPAEPMEQMDGEPISRLTSRDGRWAYTLYSDHEPDQYDRAHEPFIHALDTVAGRAVCIDLPQLEGQRARFRLALHLDPGQRQLQVLNRPQAQVGSRPLLAVDTRSFEVRVSKPGATASGGVGVLPPIAALGAAAAALLAWTGLRRRRGAGAAETRPR